MRNFQCKQKISNFSAWFMLAVMLAVLTGCGPGVGATTGTGATSGVAASVTAATIQLQVSSQQMSSSATATTLLTAVVLDSSGQALSGKAVTFSKGADSTAYFSNVSAITSANGVATATLNLGTNMANRTIAVSATADSAVGSNTVDVVNTTIAISGNSSLAFGATTPLTISVKNSVGVAVPGVTIAVASQRGNTIVLSPINGVSNSAGQITATVTAAVAGNDVLTVTGAGATQTQALTINSSSFAFAAPVVVAPAATPEIVVNTPTSVTVNWSSGGAPVVGSLVSFSSSRGTISGSPFTTLAGGVATVTISSASTGAAIITASGPGGTPAATLNVVFVTTSASTITAQANPSTVAVNTNGSQTNKSTISVVVRDAALNLVKNARVNFGLTDTSGGSLSAGTAVTDITGTATVDYIAGSISSGQNGVHITATVTDINGVAITPVANVTPLTLTVAGQALLVRLGTDNLVGTSGPQYAKQYFALVTTAAGTAVPDGTLVSFALRPATLPINAFYKGRYVKGATTWVKDATVGFGCGNEDLLFNGIISSNPLIGSVDTNLNGILDPNGDAVVTTSSTTSGGFATATITYSKSYATWVVVSLEARAGTSGNDPPAVVTLGLPGAAADYADLNVAPPGQFSPFGVGDPTDLRGPAPQESAAACTNTW